MKRFICLIAFLVAVFAGCKKQEVNKNDIVEISPPLLQAQSVRVNDRIGGFYAGLPQHYSETTKRYPLLIFLHGSGQTGNGSTDLPLVLNDGIPELLKQGRFPPSFKVNGRFFSFIILAPQCDGYPTNGEVFSFVEFAKEHYRIDASRIYLSGLSAGGIITSDVAAENPSLFAAIVPISGISIYPDLSQKAKRLAEAGLPLWAFHNGDDATINVGAVEYFINLLNSFHPTVEAKLSRLLAFGLANHDAWTAATNPDYKENGLNMYEWMLQYHR